MVEGIYRLFDSIWRLSLVGSYCILLVILCAVMLSGAAGDQDQSDPGASVDRRDGDNLCTVDCREQCRIS